MKALERLGFTGFETDKSFLPFVFGGGGEIRTHVPVRTTRFRVELVMTASIRLQIDLSTLTFYLK